MPDLPRRLSDLAESLEGCEWNHPLLSAETCRRAMEVLKRISEVAVKHAADYPSIATVDPLVQLYAIEGCLEGRGMAIADWERLAKHLGYMLWGPQCGDEMVEEWRKLGTEQAMQQEKKRDD